jgi:hypothetical protein
MIFYSKGIKGNSWFSRFMSIPEQFFLDIMHVSFLGTLEKMLNMWCKEYKNEKKEINEFYLSPRQKKFLDQMAIKVKYPNEIKRHQREITENLGDLKANEFKNIIFYLIPLFKPVLKKEYFNHFAAYATALRIMCTPKISKEDLKDAYLLMDYFVKKFQNLYGLVNMDYKVHVHLHLALQVLNYGSLIYLTCFIFEGK